MHDVTVLALVGACLALTIGYATLCRRLLALPANEDGSP